MEDSEDVFDSYNTEISESWLEEHDLLSEIAADSSWIEGVWTDDDDGDRTSDDVCD